MTGARLATPREFLAGEPFPWPPIADIADGARVAACYFVESRQVSVTRQEKPYLKLRLCDRSGSIEARVWDDAERVLERLPAQIFAGVRGRLETFQGKRQIKVEEIVPLRVEPADLDLFLPRSTRDQQEMEAELDATIAAVADAPLRDLLARLLGPDSETGRAFRRAPAAKRNHHAYVGGLLEHALSVCGACARLAVHYGEQVDTDLLAAGALLHDIGKVREIGATSGFPYTDEGKLLGHIVLGIQIVDDVARTIRGLDPERRLLLLHLIASHQGRYEWQSPKRPKILEALILHYVDDLDAKMHQAAALLADADRGWSAYDHSFGREFFRHLAPNADDDRSEHAPGSGPDPDADPQRLDLFS